MNITGPCIQQEWDTILILMLRVSEDSLCNWSSLFENNRNQLQLTLQQWILFKTYILKKTYVSRLENVQEQKVAGQPDLQVIHTNVSGWDVIINAAEDWERCSALSHWIWRLPPLSLVLLAQLYQALGTPHDAMNIKEPWIFLCIGLSKLNSER